MTGLTMAGWRLDLRMGSIRIPADMEAYSKLDDKEFERNLEAQARRLISIVAGCCERLRDQRLRLVSSERTAESVNTEAGWLEKQMEVMKKHVSNAELSERKAKDELAGKAAAENEESNSKRSKGDDGNQKQTKDNSKSSEPLKDYIHVQARRRQATDSHSLAERVWREKISERMKFLQDLVPGCSKVTGKAVILDEIINYVQSLRQQVEFLSMKLSTVNPRMYTNMEDILSKDIFQSGGSLPPHNIYPVDTSAQTFPYSFQAHQGSNLQSNMHNGTKNPLLTSSLTAAIRINPGMQQLPVEGYNAGVSSQISSFWDNDLQNVVQMGFNQNQHENFHASDTTNHMKVEH